MWTGGVEIFYSILTVYGVQWSSIGSWKNEKGKTGMLVCGCNGHSSQKKKLAMLFRLSPYKKLLVIPLRGPLTPLSTILNSSDALLHTLGY